MADFQPLKRRPAFGRSFIGPDIFQESVFTMRPPTPISAQRLAELEDFKKKKWPGHEFQRFLCVWLRAERALSTVDIARILGLHINTVRFTQKDFIDNGISALLEMKRGGRNRCLMSLDEEAAFLARFENKPRLGGPLTVSDIKNALEKHLGRTVHKTTVYRMIRRHGWKRPVKRSRARS